LHARGSSRESTFPIRTIGGKGSKMVAVGDKFPDVALQKGPFPPQEVNMPSRLAGKKTLVVGLPGAFTPT